ncbi:MAG TPA: hypothetical protein VGR06_17170 [Actinophytocola sp.]|uniref:hypothetical protein n=1 Tax=Actinophytocola sp. TaxID=1872138 RepID=UPI002DFB06DF|nr:hypothetical protein [Actinophytocola sp.]
MLSLFHAQNGAGGGPPVLNLWETQNGVGSGPPVHNTVLEEHILPSPASGDWQLAGVFTAPLLLVAIVVATRRRMTPSGAR